MDSLNEATRRYLDLVRTFRADAPVDLSFNAIRGRKTYPPVPGMMELHDALVLPGEWLVVAGDQILCDLFLQTPSPPLTAYLARFDFGDDDIELIHEQPRALPVDRALLLGGCRNYSHWLLDYLPRLALCEDQSVPLLVNAPLTAF
jgi:capsular polysaccharide biosynthesis protein